MVVPLLNHAEYMMAAHRKLSQFSGLCGKCCSLGKLHAVCYSIDRPKQVPYRPPTNCNASASNSAQETNSTQPTHVTSHRLAWHPDSIERICRCKSLLTGICVRHNNRSDVLYSQWLS